MCGSWGSTFLKVAAVGALVAAFSAASELGVPFGWYFFIILCCLCLCKGKWKKPEVEVPFGAQREGKERDDGGSLKSSDDPLISQVYEGDPWIWKKPEIGWVKLNVDGSRDQVTNLSAGCGGVLRDASGEWLRGFAQNLNPDNYKLHQTELQAILTGLEFASKMKLNKKLVVESDSDSALNKIKKGVKPSDEDHGVVQGIRNLCFDLKVRLVCIAGKDGKKGKANGVADKLADYARVHLTSDEYLEYGDDAPLYCNELLEKDKLGYASF